MKMVNLIKKILETWMAFRKSLIHSTIFNYKILCLIFFSLLTKNVFAETIEAHKLLIQGESFSNDNHKKNEISEII